eukprot:TRINITY_DN8231_c0_g1_i1.p1 TRINITY_DN8231_c0_g1~~TRINITY_DN8231_c0_g1_i1.p1  ORF type:complete len:257 (-),score=68.01 TRINITY_DN8231_c0_g1_i1:151-921(-)
MKRILFDNILSYKKTTSVFSFNFTKNHLINKYFTEETGEANTKNFRLYILNENKKRISAWNDIPLHPNSKDNSIVTFINEISKGTNAKMEMSKDEEHHPIKQDLKNGDLRFIKHGNLRYNYGYIPQTWEDPNEEQPYTKLLGDGDPVDVVEIGTDPLSLGEVIEMKVLGVLALIDEGETDWKIIGINTNDPNASNINDINDVDKEIIDDIKEWYQIYKVCEGKEENSYGLNGECKNRDFAKEIIDHTHHTWINKIK